MGYATTFPHASIFFEKMRYNAVIMDSDSIDIDGKEYITSKRASELSQYTQDYIGQLARSSAIDARRMGGLWYVAMDSLNTYKENPSATKGNTDTPTKNIHQKQPDDVFVSFDGKDYISANRASRITGYNQDYIGQLARNGKILSKQIGKRWYIDRDGLIAHKDEKDSLLAAVQRDSLGILASTHQKKEEVPITGLRYSTDTSSDLLPNLALKPSEDTPTSEAYNRIVPHKPLVLEHSIPIRISSPSQKLQQTHLSSKPKPEFKNPILPFVHVTMALTVIVIISFGYFSLKDKSIYALTKDLTLQNTAASAAAAQATGSLTDIGTWVESLITPELSYTRAR